MTIRNLDAALDPRAIVVVGSGPRAEAVRANLAAGGFPGPVHAVEVAGIPGLPDPPDLAIVATAAEAVPAAIAALGARGGKVAVVLSDGITAGNGLRQAMLDAARPHLLRIIGPNTLGLLVPAARINASLAPTAPAAGGLALISQSGAIATALIEWAADRGIGFSQILSLGDMADVDVGDGIDLVAQDPRTRAILLYLETVPEARKFLSAARAAARAKPVIAIKAGRTPAAAAAAQTHTGALSGSDAVVEAALRRAGILRVRGLSELFAAAETVARFRPLARARLAIVTNGGGAGVLAVDGVTESGGELADLAPATVAALDAALPGGWSRGNPVDIGGDAAPAGYAAALEALSADPGVDALLAMNCPSAFGNPVEAAEAVAQAVRRGTIRGKPVLACWMGGSPAREARTALRSRGVASYDTPGTAAAAVGHLAAWGQAQAALLHVPDRQVDALGAAPLDARAKAMAIFTDVAAEGRAMLTEPEAKAVLAAYGIPVPEIRIARSPAEVAEAAAAIGGGGQRVVVKLLSRSASHKSEVGGVVLDVPGPVEAAAAARGIAARAADAGVPVDGFAVQPMIRRPEGLELILGIGRDPVFGPVLLFGTGGVAVELLQDTAVALPPIDSALAGYLVERTRAGRLLAGFRGRAPADVAAVEAALVALSHMIEDLPCLRAVDVNPLIADADGVLALDARMVIDPDDLARRPPNPDLSIRPYPAGWRRTHRHGEALYELRPIRPVDALLYGGFLARISAEDIRLRFMAPRKHFPDEYGLRLSQLDYDREMAFVAVNAEGELTGVARMVCEPGGIAAEYAALIRSDLAGQGMGTALMTLLIDYARDSGLERLDGLVLRENRGMLGLVTRLGFASAFDPDDPAVVRTWLDLRPPASPPAAPPAAPPPRTPGRACGAGGRFLTFRPAPSGGAIPRRPLRDRTLEDAARCPAPQPRRQDGRFRRLRAAGALPERYPQGAPAYPECCRPVRRQPHGPDRRAPALGRPCRCGRGARAAGADGRRRPRGGAPALCVLYRRDGRHPRRPDDRQSRRPPAARGQRGLQGRGSRAARGGPCRDLHRRDARPRAAGASGTEGGGRARRALSRGRDDALHGRAGRRQPRPRCRGVAVGLYRRGRLRDLRPGRGCRRLRAGAARRCRGASGRPRRP